MCVCTPAKRTPWCGAPGCEWPEHQESEKPAPPPARIYIQDENGAVVGFTNPRILPGISEERPPDATFFPTPVREMPNGSVLVAGVLLTPEDAVRMLIRTMGRDPKASEYDGVPSRIVRALHAARGTLYPEDELRQQVMGMLAEGHD